MKPILLNAEFFLLHNGTTAEDIKTILAGKQKILPLLGQSRKEFGAEYWSGRPDLTAPQLDMLRKGQDIDGVKLNEKSFVFGNKIDRAPNKNTSQDNLAVLRNDAVNKYQITLGNHIVGGSARAYLEKIGLIIEKVASKVLDEWQTPDGVKILLDKMQDYYDNDRFEVLKRRAENILSKTRTVLQNLLERYSSGELNYSDVSTEILMDIQSRLSFFTKEANRITQIHTMKIFRERPFTKALKDDVNSTYSLVEEAHLPLIENEELELVIDPDGVYPTSKVDGNVRDKLSVLFIENVMMSASEVTSARQRELRQEGDFSCKSQLFR